MNRLKHEDKIKRIIILRLPKFEFTSKNSAIFLKILELEIKFIIYKLSQMVIQKIKIGF